MTTDTQPTHVWGAYYRTRWGDQGMDLFATEADAFDAHSDLVDVSDMDVNEARDFWLLAETNLEEFKRQFFELLDPSGHELHVERLMLPGRKGN